MNNESAWGSSETELFFSLTPEHILSAVETISIKTTGRCLALNSLENRVYEVELDLDEKPRNPSDKFRIVKFYRPGRWSKETIMDEHSFLFELSECDIPVVTPLKDDSSQSLFICPDTGLYFALFYKYGGRIEPEINTDSIERVGRLLGRIHAVGAARAAENRLTLTPSVYGNTALEILKKNSPISQHSLNQYLDLGRAIIDQSLKLFDGIKAIRLHGDAHVGNLLWGSDGPFWVDFDDMINGPAVQDLWLLIPSRYSSDDPKWKAILSGYSQMNSFDYAQLKMIESLRALRTMHFNGWITLRWSDPSFPKAFPNFKSEHYWAEQIRFLQEQKDLLLATDSVDL